MNSMDIQHDRAGFYLCWGCLVSRVFGAKEDDADVFLLIGKGRWV